MKLVFPNGDHGQVLLNPGPNRIGSEAQCAAVLNLPGIQPVHCVIHLTSSGANLQVPAGAGPVAVNGKPVPDIMGLRSGDLLSMPPACDWRCPSSWCAACRARCSARCFR